MAVPAAAPESPRAAAADTPSPRQKTPAAPPLTVTSQTARQPGKPRYAPDAADGPREASRGQRSGHRSTTGIQTETAHQPGRPRYAPDAAGEHEGARRGRGQARGMAKGQVTGYVIGQVTCQ